MAMVLPKIDVGPGVLSDFSKALQMEWIVTNGLGGYASSTVLGINTRKYHGILVAAFNPPVDRRVLLAKVHEEVVIGNKTFPLGSNEFENSIHPEGHMFIVDFCLAPLPTYEYHVHGVRLQKVIFMPHRKNATVATYEVYNPHENQISIRISPLVNSRHFHDVTNKDNLTWSFIQRSYGPEVVIQPSVPLSTLIISSSDGQFLSDKDNWVKRIYLREDASRRESCFDDCFQPGSFELQVAPKERKKFHVIATGARNEEEARRLLQSIQQTPGEIEAVYNQELERRRGLLKSFQERYADLEIRDWLKWLILACYSFLVKRESTNTNSVIAGYHWFEDWGRDSLISLPGLALVSGNFSDAREILLTFKHYCRDGLIPNRFPDKAGDEPIYNSVDATLWFFNAILQYLKYTNDFDFVRSELWEVSKSIVEHLEQGTLYNIKIEEDGLLAHGPQLTWMDATVNNQPITPRDGKAVEIQALWFNALKTMELLSNHFSQKKTVQKYSEMAEKARKSFIEKFWDANKGFLCDVVHGEHVDSSLRPNQVIAVALDFSILERAKENQVVEVVWRELWGTYGLKTLTKKDPRYVEEYFGNWNQRNKAYHNGTVWAWLLGPFAKAFLKVKNYKEPWRGFAFKMFLQPLFQEEILSAGLGTISEIFNGDPPHSSRGCISQAWSVAEPLRAYVEDVVLKRPPYERQVLGILS